MGTNRMINVVFFIAIVTAIAVPSACLIWRVHMMSEQERKLRDYIRKLEIELLLLR